jgi:hypothetical protein
MRDDEFYIGYESEMPPRMARRVRAVAAALLVLALVLSGALVLAQRRSSAALFEYGQTRTFEGRLLAGPYPALVMTSGSDTRYYWLVAPGKHGAAALVDGFDGAEVRLAGTLIRRDEDVMIQVDPGSITRRGTVRAEAEPLVSVGAVVVTGEIVDSKCHLGVMKPGEGPTHRDCAVRCLLGGVPPMLVPHGGEASPGRLTLVTRDGHPFAADALAGITGRPVTVRGELLERDAQRFVATSVDQIFKLP